MSILLDAVTRDKQQSQGITHDVVLTPRAQYKAQQESGKGLKLVAIFISLLLLMILAAWLLSKALYPESPAIQGFGDTMSVNSNSNPALTQQELAKQVSTQQVSPNVADSEFTSEPIAESTQEIRLAGKVALPIAQPMTVTQVAMVPTSVSPTNSAAAEEPNDLMAALLKAQQSVENNNESTSNLVPNKSIATSDSEPIILGANSNQRGDELLESLKEQVQDAANDVGLKTAEPAANNNLLAAFEAALKDVERDNAVATPVTEPKLDPIPVTPKSDDIPKYGQLPAGLQLQVPEFNINAHVYSSAPDNRWLNVDGAELQEGDSIQGKLTIVEIRPRDVVLAIQGTEFKVPAI
ncbi:general secretion pathway protein GspB [Shewanella schlegeliana]|uniref:General secretion pathway protein GspB n=1 Tax=Shewanella schlegeliana TaxID=190308 RepID=A0ABS1SUM8_9GAMM|nr:general secretion pathway protein GspB [Shewanella schlegeliana]MBL4912243.1 general secretion pathway protein GspB [Shewanella schlegeliana]MCL1110670.1 general secretion pathway protein GspB [Shewanella schlegeliana]GIU22495.1 general secretion pathway protein GspB [Shewanella schlegeliana]